MTRRAIIALGALVVCVAAAAGFFVWRVSENIGDPARLVTILDGVPVPSSWQAVHTEQHRDLLTGSSAYRWFLVDADPEDAVLTVKEAVQAAGFTVEVPDTPRDWCHQERFVGSTVANPGPCPPRELYCTFDGPGGTRRCTMSAMRDRDRLFITFQPRGTLSSYDVDSAAVSFGDPQHSVVTMSAHRRAKDGLFP